MDNRKKEAKQPHKTFIMPDITLSIFTLIMTLFGLIMIFNASSFKAHELGLNQFHFLWLQLIWIGVSIIPFLIIYFWDYRKYSKLSLIMYIIVVILLFAVLIIGENINGATRWIKIAGVQIQPTEFLKPVIILFLASWLSKEDKSTQDLKRATDIKEVLQTRFGKNMIIFFIILGVTLLLIVLEPDLGTTMITGITAVAIFFISGRDSIQRLWTTGLLGIFGILAIIAGFLENYRLKRILTFVDLIRTGEVTNPRTDGYQMSQILMGIGSGGFLGVGFAQSIQKFGYLVENTAFTDSIYAIILEELGMLGGIVIILAWLIFLYKGGQIALRAPDRLGKLLAAGITIWLTTQAFINMSANVGLMPLTGIPLPFLSYGGSSTLVTFIGLGILLNVDRISKKIKESELKDKINRN